MNYIPTSASGRSTDLGAVPTFLESAQDFCKHPVGFIEGVAVIGLGWVRWAMDLSEKERERKSNATYGSMRSTHHAVRIAVGTRYLALKKEKIT